VQPGAVLLLAVALALLHVRIASVARRGRHVPVPRRTGGQDEVPSTCRTSPRRNRPGLPAPRVAPAARTGRTPAGPRTTGPRRAPSSSRDIVAAQGGRTGTEMGHPCAAFQGLARQMGHQHRYPPGRRLPWRLQPAVSGSDGRRDDAPPADRKGRFRGFAGVCAGWGAAATVACHARSPGSPAVRSAASPCKPIEPPPPRSGARAGGAAEFATP
jgi:hypothetical protein